MSFIDTQTFVWLYIGVVGPIVGAVLIYLLALDALRKGDRLRQL